MIKQFVIIYDSTIKVRKQAIRSDSRSVLPAFSPSAFAQIRQILRKKVLVPFTMTLSESHVALCLTYFNSVAP